ncbi:MAG: hypothetical protein N2315_02700 [Thermanaerothrix sp.]|nr:hypothetical protein [Thermanaerothrix sp.]
MKRKMVGALLMAALLGLVVAGSAMARPVGYGDGFGWDMGGGMGPGHHRMMGGGFCGGPVDPKDVPKDVQDMMREAQRLQLQMRLALTEDKVDAGKVRSLFERIHELRGKIGRWRGRGGHKERRFPPVAVSLARGRQDGSGALKPSAPFVMFLAPRAYRWRART